MGKPGNLKKKKSQASSKFQLNRETLISLSVIVVLTLIVYSPAFENNFLNWDDDQVILENPSIKNLSVENLKDFFSTTNINSYNPLVMLTFAVEYKFFNLNPKPFHIFNIILHIINSLLVFWLIYLICRNRLISLFTAMLFSVHPLHVEAVVWVTALKDVLFTLFYLSSVISFIYFLRKDRGKIYYIISLLLFIFAVLSKPVAVTLPAILILTDYYITGKFDIKLIKNKVPFIIVSAVFIVITLFTFNKGGSIGSDFSVFDNILIFFYSIFFYLYKLLLPIQLSPIYPYPVKMNGWMPLSYFLAPVIVIGLVIYLIKSNKNNRNILFALFFFLITILPVSNLIPVKNNSLVFDRFTYIPYIGFFYLICSWLYDLYSKKTIKGANVKNLVFSLIVITVILLSYLSFQRAAVWKNGLTLWTDVIEKYPDNPNAYCNRGEEYYKTGDYYKSVVDYDMAIKLDSTKENYFNDRGNVLRDKKEYNKALLDYEKALQLKPGNWITYNNMGILFTYQKKYDDGLINFNKAIDLFPKYSHAYTNKGNLYKEIQNYDSAIIFYNKAIETDPNFSNAYYGRALTYMKKEDYKNAILDFKKVLSIDPDLETAYQKLTYTYFLAKDYDMAWEYLDIMKNKNFPLDKKFIEMLQKESGKRQ